MAEPVTLITSKSDAELAANFRAELTPKLTEVAAIIDRARVAGININFSVGPDSFSRIALKEITIVKPL